MALVSGGGGAAFAGGAVPAAIDVTDPAVPSQFSPGVRIAGLAGLGVAPLSLLAAAGQADDLVDVQDSSGAVSLFVLPTGYLFIKKNAAPPDGDVATSAVTLWLDATPAATKLMVKAKDSGGTVRTAAIALA